MSDTAGRSDSALAVPTGAVDHADRTGPSRRKYVATHLLGGALLVTVVLVLLGLPITHLSGSGPIVRLDRTIDAWFAAHRSGTENTETVFGSGSANTQTAIAVAFAAFFLLRWWLGRWYESWVVVAAIVGELVIFLVVTAVVHRPRPPVHRLDVAPPTSSFPSGHTGAAVALYGCLAVIAWRYLRSSSHRRLAAVLCTFLCLIPLAVAISRAYRGMHYPSDIVAGALGGALWLAVVLWTFKPGPDAPVSLTGPEHVMSGRRADPATVDHPGRR